MCYCNIIYAAAQHFANNCLPNLPNKYRMTKKFIVVLAHLDEYFAVAERENLNWIPDAEVTWDLEKARTDSRFKIIMIPVFNAGGELPFKEDCGWADLVIGITTEILSGHCPTLLEQLSLAINNKNIIVVSCGSGLTSPDRDRVYSPSLRWVNYIFDNHQDYVPSPRPTAKSYLFDALLGQSRYPRRYILYKFIDDNLLDKSLVSMWTTHDFTDPDFDKKCFDQESRSSLHGDLVRKYGIINFYRSSGLDDLELPGIILPKADSVNYGSVYYIGKNCKVTPGQSLTMSMDLPTKIFDASWYSIVAETCAANTNVFITEKTSKTIIAKRVFVLFAGSGSLQYLRSQGFRTFDGIIDESYDSEPNDVKRFQQAWEQVRLLSTLNPVEVYQRADEILEHNYNLLPTLRNEHLKIRDFIAQWLPC